MGNKFKKERSAASKEQENQRKIEEFNKIPQVTRTLVFGYVNEIFANETISIRLDELCDVVFMFLSRWKIFETALNIIRENGKLYDGVDYIESKLGNNAHNDLSIFLHLDHPYIDRSEVTTVITEISLKRTWVQHQKLLISFLGYIPFEQFDFITASRIFVADCDFKFPDTDTCAPSNMIRDLIHHFINVYYGKMSSKYSNISCHQLESALHGMLLLNRILYMCNQSMSHAQFGSLFVTKHGAFQSEEFIELVDEIYQSISKKRLKILDSDESKGGLWKPSYQIL